MKRISKTDNLHNLALKAETDILNLYLPVNRDADGDVSKYNRITAKADESYKTFTDEFARMKIELKTLLLDAFTKLDDLLGRTLMRYKVIHMDNHPDNCNRRSQEKDNILTEVFEKEIAPVENDIRMLIRRYRLWPF
ncbi:MAG: hypothetical protein LBP64_00775 [Tannerella sp.]|jgi:hypothetical protein|nr:hypothetical protein [Tannerella sp.]